MKLALATHTPEVVNPPPVALLVGSFEERLGKAHSLGYDGVELMAARPKELDAEQIRSQLRSAGLEAAAIASGPVFMQDRLTLLADTPETMRRAAARLIELVDLAAALEAPLVTVGSFRGRLAWAGGDSAVGRLKEALAAAADHGSARGVRLVLEPLNRYEADVVQNYAQAVEFIAEIGHPGIGVLLDTYHMNIEEASLTATIQAAARSGRLWHVHLGDSNRLPPGQGHIPFAELVDSLRQCGYVGWLSAELNGKPDPDAAAAATVQTMRPLMGRR